MQRSNPTARGTLLNPQHWCLEVAFSTYTRSGTKLTVDTADQPTVPPQLEDDSERACTADVWQRGAGVYRGRLTAWSGRLQRTFDSMERASHSGRLAAWSGRLAAWSGRVQWTFDSMELACTTDVWQRGAGVYSGRLTARSCRVQRTFDSAERACTADVWQRGAGVYSERLRAWIGRVQRTFDSGERACTHNETQRDEANIAIVTRLAQFPKPY